MFGATHLSLSFISSFAIIYNKYNYSQIKQMKPSSKQTKTVRTSKTGISILKDEPKDTKLEMQKEKALLLRQIKYQQQRFSIRRRELLRVKQEEKILDSDCLRYSEKIFKGKKRIQDMKNNLGDTTTFFQENPYFNQLAEQMMLEQAANEQQNQINPDTMSYEQLLELGDQIGKVSKGLDMSQMEKLKRLPYKKVKGTIEEKCSVCYEEYRSNDILIDLKCKHCYHEECIIGWLKSEKVCPLCKQYVL